MRPTRLVLTLALCLVMLASFAPAIPLGHAVASISYKTNITSVTTNWDFEWPWQTKTFFANGLYWTTWRSQFGACASQVFLCPVMGYSVTGSSGWAGGFNFGSGSQIPCGSVSGTPPNVNPNLAADFAVATNGTFVFGVCDLSTTTNACCSGAGALWFSEGQLVNTNGVGSVTWQPVQQVQAGQANHFFLNEMIAVEPLSPHRIFIAYDNNSQTTHKSNPWVTSSVNDGVTWTAPLLLNSTLATSSADALGYGWNLNLFHFVDNKIVLLYGIFAGDTTVLGGTLMRQREFTEAGGWTSEHASGISDILDGLDITSDHSQYAYFDAPSCLCSSYTAIGAAGGTGWGDSCGFQDCGRPSWTYNEVTNTWGDRQVIDATPSGGAWDEHTQLITDTLTNYLYLLRFDISCITHSTPGWVYIQRKPLVSGPWNAIPGQFLAQVSPVTGNPQGGDPAPEGCAGTKGQGGFTAMTETTSTQNGQTAVGFAWHENVSSTQFNLEYAIITFTADPPSGGGGGGGGGGGAGATGAAPGSPASSPLFTPILLLSALTVFIVFIGIAARASGKKTRRRR